MRDEHSAAGIDKGEQISVSLTQMSKLEHKDTNVVHNFVVKFSLPHNGRLQNLFGQLSELVGDSPSRL